MLSVVYLVGLPFKLPKVICAKYMPKVLIIGLKASPLILFKTIGMIDMIAKMEKRMANLFAKWKKR